MKKICLIIGGYVIGCFSLIGLKTMIDRVGGSNVRSSRDIYDSID